MISSLRKLLETGLKLKVNENKSAVDIPSRRKFLGFSIYHGPQGPAIRLAPKSIERVKAKIRDLTDRNKSVAMEERIRELNQYLTRWL